MTELADVHLALFLTRATPLRRWDEMGILEREAAIYLRLRPHLAGISIVTSGGPEELSYQERLPGIRLLHNRWGFGPNLYSLLAPILHRRALREATVYKTNQLDGAWTAVVAARLHRRPVVVRAGYGWALNYRREHGETRKACLIRHLERWALRRADRVAMTTHRLREYVVEEHSVAAGRIVVAPNYVDTNLFHPVPGVRPEAGRVIFVGALKEAKNLPVLLHAVARIPAARLTLVGDGPLRPGLTAMVHELAIVERVTFAGRVTHDQLPCLLNRAQVFALTSRYEGHPKALIEAMACGTAVVGTDVEGTRDVIRHEETGLLCPPTVDGLAAALARLLHDASLRNRLGQAARELAVQEYSLDRSVARELAILTEVKR